MDKKARIEHVIIADGWDFGFNLWVDDVRFDWQDYKYCDFATDSMITSPDLTQDKKVDLADFELFAQNWLEGIP